MGVWEYFVKVFGSSFRSPFAITGYFLAFIPVIRAIIVRYRPQYEDIMKTHLYITIPLGMLLGLFVLSLLVSGYNIYKSDTSRAQQTINQLTTDLKIARDAAIPSIQQVMLMPFFKNTDIPIANLSMVTSKISNKTFEHCNIIGPAILFAIGKATFDRCRFQGSEEMLFIETTNKKLWGVVAIENTTFIDCDFSKISFIGPKDKINEMKKGVKFLP
jgi:hypothetical protein